MRLRGVILSLTLLCASTRAGEAEAILRATGIQGGLVVHAGCGDGTLTAALRANDRYVVHGLDADVSAARKHIQSLGLYGPVSVARWDGKRLPYSDNLVNLVVAERPLPMAEVMRALVPDGVAYVKANGAWTKTVKPRPKDIDDWTHYHHGPDNNAVARDTRVGPPRHLQWKSGPMWCRSHDGVPSSIAIVLSANGRLFSVIDEGLTGDSGLPQRWTIVARDACNGILLWRVRLPRRLPEKGIAAVGDRVYAILGDGGTVVEMDAATGKTLGTFKGTERAGELVCAEGVLVVAASGTKQSGDGKDNAIVALATEDGRALWRTPSRQVVRGTLAAADGRVAYLNGKEAVCLAVRSGKQEWRVPCEADPRSGSLIIYGGAMFASVRGGLRAFDPETGKTLWKGPGINRRLGFFGAQGLVWRTSIHERGRTFLWTPAPVVSTGYDPKTGEVKRTVTVQCLTTPGHHIRCYSAKATERYLLLPKRGVEFVDLQGEDHMRHDWLRAPCRHGVIAANGLLYTPPHQCFCYPGVRLTGYNAVAAKVTAGLSPRDRLERGPAYGRVGRRQEAVGSGQEWPMYRHDPLRSGRAGCDVPAELQPVWRQKVGGTLCQPVVADGRLLVTDRNAHTIRCLDADTGKPLWSHVAGGRIDSPPTVSQGLVLFGSTDGFLTCLRASDGALAWHFRAAPEDRRIVVFDQLESPWPVHGSVVVQNGVVYCTAGRSSFLDGGIWVYGLDAATGEVRHTAHLETERPDVNSEAGRPFDMEGARTDLLVSDGTDLYMFYKRFGPDLSLKAAPRLTKLGDREVSLHLMSNTGFLDTAWFDRSFWMYSRRWPGYYFSYNAPKSGEILVFDDETTYGLHVFDTRQGHSPRFRPGTEGYELFADSNDAEPVLRPTAIGREKGSGFSRTLPPKWSVRIPLRANAMVLAGQYLCAAGTPDEVPKDDAYAALEGRRGGRLWIVSAKDGRRVAERPLEHPPVFDGLIAAGGRLYLATTDGHVTCMGAKQ